MMNSLKFIFNWFVPRIRFFLKLQSENRDHPRHYERMNELNETLRAYNQLGILVNRLEVDKN